MISHGISDFGSNNWTGQVYEATAQEFPWRNATAFGDCMVTKVCSEAFNKAPFTASLLTSCDSENHGATSDVCKMFTGIWKSMYGRVEDFLFLPVFGWATPAANRKMLVVAGTCASLVFHRADMVLVGCRRPEFDLRTAQTHATTLLGFLL